MFHYCFYFALTSGKSGKSSGNGGGQSAKCHRNEREHGKENAGGLVMKRIKIDKKDLGSNYEAMK